MRTFPILRKLRSLIVLGLNCGTSLDGISATVVKISNKAIKPLYYRTIAYKKEIRNYLRPLYKTNTTELSRANFLIGRSLADCASRIMKDSCIKIDLIASHGQTIIHRPRDKIAHTLQIGEPSIIAQKTGITTVADFRPADIVAGGQGAPLVPFFDHFAFSKLGPVALLNLGGICNATIVNKSLSKTYAFDIGPCNCLIDQAARIATGDKLSCDLGGKISASGSIRTEIVQKILSHPFYKLKPPKSTCVTEFDTLLKLSERGKDLVASCVFAVALSIRQAFERFAREKVKEVIISGGSIFNKTLFNHLKWMLYPMKVQSISDFGWHPLAKEPACFALLGFMSLNGIKNNVPPATSASRKVVLGKIVPSDNFKSLLTKLWS